MARLKQLTLVVCRVEWLFLALLLPVVLLIRPAMTPLLLLLPLLWLVRWRGTGHFVPPTPLDLGLLLLLLMVLVSLWATFDVAFSLQKVAGLIYGVALFFAVVAYAGRSRRSLWTAVALFLILEVGVAVAGLFLTQWSATLPLLAPLVARLPDGLVFVNPNELAGVLLWGAPLLIVLARRALGEVFGGESRRRGAAVLLLTGTAALFVTGILLMTRSRSALLGLTAAVLFLTLSALRQHPRLLLLLLVATLLTASLVAIQVTPETWQRISDPLFAPDADPLGDTGLASRMEIWQRALYGIQDFPITGMGMGTFRRVLPLLYPSFLVNPASEIPHAHNHLLQTALDLGIPGLVAYLAIWLGAAAMLWVVLRHTRDQWQRALALGLGASLLAYFVYGLTDTVALGARPGFLYWMLLGLVAALHRLTFAGAGPEGER